MNKMNKKNFTSITNEVRDIMLDKYNNKEISKGYLQGAMKELNSLDNDKQINKILKK